MLHWTNGIIKPYIKESRYRLLCEIGSSNGACTDKLLELPQVEISVIDPCLDEDLCKKYAHNNRVKVYKGLSLEVLPILSEKFDCTLIDGDHNWYTVFNELKVIEKKGLLNKGGTIFFHDICWPYGRRDLYYLPGSIPIGFRHPYAKKGIVRGQSELSDTSGLCTGNNNALFEGGVRNGILTAIEDFMKQHKNRYIFFNFKFGSGLGVLCEKKCLKINIFLKCFFIEKCFNIISKSCKLWSCKLGSGLLDKGKIDG